MYVCHPLAVQFISQVSFRQPVSLPGKKMEKKERKKYPFLHRCYYPHPPRESVSPVCWIFINKQPEAAVIKKKTILSLVVLV